MRDAMVTRSFITTVVKIKGKEDMVHFPNMYGSQVRPFLDAQNLEIESIREELIRYGMTETEFLTVAKPLPKKAREEKIATD